MIIILGLSREQRNNTHSTHFGPIFCSFTSFSSGFSDDILLDVNILSDYNGTQVQGRRRCVRLLW